MSPRFNRSRRLITGLLAGLLAVLALSLAASAAESPSDINRRLTAEDRRVIAKLRADYAKFRDPAAAVAAGYHPTDVCVDQGDEGPGGMGYHYVHPELIMAPIDPARPAILVYVPTKKGPRLGAVEWLQPDADQDLTTDDDRPTLFGTPFDGPMEGHEPGMPRHYDLHAWLFERNPDGMFTAWNPNVRCS